MSLRDWEREHIKREKLRTPQRQRPAELSRWLLLAGIAAAILISMTAFRLVVGLGTFERPAQVAVSHVPPFSALVSCNAHVSHEILRIKNKLPSHNGRSELRRLHRDYRRLHRLMRQVGRREGIVSEQQTQRLRTEVKRLNEISGTTGASARDARCRAMAQLPIARKRYSQPMIRQQGE